MYGKFTKASSNAHADISRGTRGLDFNLSIHLRLYFEYASSDSSGESVQARLSLRYKAIR